MKKPTDPEIINFEVEGMTIPVAVERRAGLKNASLRVMPQGVTLRAPRNISRKAVAEVLSAKSRWLAKHWSRMQEASEASRERAENNLVRFRGDLLRVIVCEESGVLPSGGKVELDMGLIIIHLPAGHPDRRGVLTRWMRRQAELTIKKRLAIINHKLQYSYHTVAIRDQKTRWGSCSMRKTLSFNWRLIMMPPEVLDYVIVHELCHLQEMSHSPRFWSLVESAMPGFREPRGWLRRHGKEYGKSTEV